LQALRSVCKDGNVKPFVVRKCQAKQCWDLCTFKRNTNAFR